MKNIEAKLKELEKRIQKLESPSKKLKSEKAGPSKGSLPGDLDELMQKHSKTKKGGIIFSGIAMPSDNPDRLVRWSGAGGFESSRDVDDFLDNVSDEGVTLFCSNFSSPEKLLIIKALIKDGPLNQKELLSLTKITQGQFYHHIKDLISGKFIHKVKKDQYDITPMGHVLALSFMGIIHSFTKK
jgi:hypothetical protein